MLTVFSLDQGLVSQTFDNVSVDVLPRHAVWLDLLNPTRLEEKVVERLLSLEVPTPEEMQEIEASSRLYVDNRAIVMTLPVLNRTATTQPEIVAVTFILADHRLITLRYADPSPFSAFIQRVNRQPGLIDSGEYILLGLLEQIADRLADILEGAVAEVENISHEIFQNSDDSDINTDFKHVLRRIGYAGDLATKAKDSLLGLNRLILFFSAQTSIKKDASLRLETLSRDVSSIDEHARFLSEKVSFLLNATLGMLNIEQNNIIKIFSVAAVAFMPPTLIASIYGMNFHQIPELSWAWGYPLAVVMMVASAVVPLWQFKRKKWL